jgi:HK97 family phage portal protein
LAEETFILPEETWFDKLKTWITEKIFRLGPVVLERAEEAWGHEPSVFAPEKYGEYIATSVGVYTCATYRAQNLAKLSLRLYKVDAAGNRKEVTDGELYELLQKVNPFWTFGRLIRMTELARCLWGSGFWVLERGPNGRRPPQEIWWARPDRMRVVPDRMNYLSGFIYENLGERLPFRVDEVVWLRCDNPIDEYSGLSPIAAARLSIDLGTAGLRSNARLFEQGLQLGGIIAPADDNTRWTPEQTKQLEEMFARRFKGVDKAHRWAVLSGGVKAQPLGVNPKDAEFINQMKWSLNDIARVYHIPPELIGDHEHATYSNIEQAYKAFWSDCMEPEATELAEELTEQLLPLFPGQADLAEFDMSHVPALQEDRSKIVDQMAKLSAIGVPLNKLLEEFMPQLLPGDGKGYKWGDVWWAPSTLLPAAGTGGGAPPQPEEGKPEESAQRALRLVRQMLGEYCHKTVEFGSPEHERVWKTFVRRADPHERQFRELVEDLFRRQRDSVLARLREGKAAKALPVDEEPFSLAQWIKRFKREALPLLRQIFRDSGEATLEELAVSVSFDLGSPAAVRFLERRAQRFAREVNDTTWQQLKASLKEGVEAGESVPKLAERVEEVMAGRIRSSAETIARTEVIGASNGGALEAARQSGVVKRKTWLAALDERTRETHVEAHGQSVGLDEDFQVGAGSGPAPGQIGLPEEDINCRCTLVWEVD